MVTLAYKPHEAAEGRSSDGSLRSSCSGSLGMSAHASRDRLSLSSFAPNDINEAEEIRMGARVEVPHFEYVKFGIWPEMNFTQQIEMRKELKRVRRENTDIKNELRDLSRSASQCAMHQTVSDASAAEAHSRFTRVSSKVNASHIVDVRKALSTVTK